MLTDLITVLRCPTCKSTLTDDGMGPARAAALVCSSCGLRAPIRDGIPRFVETPEEESARRTQASFGYEWTHFNDPQPSGEINFNDYFQGVDFASIRGRLVLDAGCGMGRHARQIAAFAGRVVALDFSRAIEQAKRNTASSANVDCVQADLLRLPLADGSFDFVYSLGVLHHLEQTEEALQGLVRKVRPGGRMRIYLYWKRHGWSGRFLSIATAARRVTTRLPFPVLRAVCWLLSVLLFVAVVLPYRLLAALGVKSIEEWPLFIYARYPFQVLYNDQFDRFSAPIEKRYDPDEVRALLSRAGLVDIEVRPCFGWIGDGRKPLADRIPSTP